MYAGISSLESAGVETLHIGAIDSYRRGDGMGGELDTTLLPDEQRASLETALRHNHGCVPVFVGAKQASGHYDGYCKTELWPLLHYTSWGGKGDGRADGNQFWGDYVAVNRLFAEAIAREYRSGDIVWVHDYHLLLVPQILRELLEHQQKVADAAATALRVPIGLFLHTPFPSSELFRALPRRRQLLEGILGSTLIGFQTYGYSRHFISSCSRVLGLESSPSGIDYNGRQVEVGIFPVGINVEAMIQRSSTAAVAAQARAIREMYPDKLIIFGRDRLDQVSGIDHKMYAFEHFLRNYPEWRGKVVLIQELAKFEARLNDTVTRINSSFGSLNFTPIHHHMHWYLSKEEYYALLSIADLGLITPVRDGMNTTSHEFIVCQREKHSPLILSEFAGVAGSMPAAYLVNPYDYSGVSRAIDTALRLGPTERAAKHRQLMSYVTSHTAGTWARSLVGALVASSGPGSIPQLPPGFGGMLLANNKTFGQGQGAAQTRALNMSSLATAYQNARRRLLLFDYDGTLTPIVSTPSAALPSPKMLAGLSALCQDPRNSVWIISGRDMEFLDQHITSAVPGIGVSAEHGCFLRMPYAGTSTSPSPSNSGSPRSTALSRIIDEARSPTPVSATSSDTELDDGSLSEVDISTIWVNLLEGLDMSWMDDVQKIFSYYTERTEGSFVERKHASVVWHYRLADQTYAMFQAKECHNHLENAVVSKLPVEIMLGKKNIEVRPVSMNKGEIVRRLLEETRECDFVFCAGDDKTDEDMFRMLNRHAATTESIPDQVSAELGSADSEQGKHKEPMRLKRRLSTSRVHRHHKHSHLTSNNIYTVSVGSAQKGTSALWYVETPFEVIDAVTLMASSSKSSAPLASSTK
ncbi:hypothetical protein GQ42DRAFT_167882 [Ramicandelaber brevisporus]|nr:hypothetical protein GQ42DRAFT_167882 [Ramicandelaber brevisporus]